MKNTNKIRDAHEKNKCTYEAFHSTLDALYQSNAVVGRIDLAIVVDVARIPRLVDDSMMEIMQCGLVDQNKEMLLHPFSSAMKNESLLIWFFHNLANEDRNKNFPFAEGFRHLVQSVPELSGPTKKEIEKFIEVVKRSAPPGVFDGSDDTDNGGVSGAGLAAHASRRPH